MTTETDLERLLLNISEGRTKYSTDDQLVTAWRSQNPRLAARKLFQLLHRQPREYIVNAVVPLLASLAAADLGWASLVQKSLSKKGRCPSPLRSALQVALESKSQLGPIPQLDPSFSLFEEPIEPDTKRISSTPQDSIRLDKQSTSITGISSILLSTLAAIDTGKRSRIRIELEGTEQLYIPGLAATAIWCRTNNLTSVELAGASPATTEYLETIKFQDFIENGTSVSRRTSDDFALHLTEISKATSRDSEASNVAAKISNICNEWGTLSQEQHSALTILLGEIIENSFRHSGRSRNVVVAAQVYPRRKKISISIADNGMGVRESFRLGHNREANAEIKTDADALAVAIRPLVTSKPVRRGFATGHAGYGLFIASELAARNRGTFSIASGVASLVSYRSGWKPKRTEYSHGFWHGTITSLILDLKQLIDIGEVYRAIPSPVGFEDEDFFS